MYLWAFISGNQHSWMHGILMLSTMVAIIILGWWDLFMSLRFIGRIVLQHRKDNFKAKRSLLVLDWKQLWTITYDSDMLLSNSLGYWMTLTYGNAPCYLNQWSMVKISILTSTVKYFESYSILWMTCTLSWHVSCHQCQTLTPKLHAVLSATKKHIRRILKEVLEYENCCLCFIPSIFPIGTTYIIWCRL